MELRKGNMFPQGRKINEGSKLQKGSWGVFLGGGQSEKGSQMGRDGMTTEPPVVAEYRKGTEISRYFHRVARPM